MFSRVLVANRGEIALRIIRACQELGIETVAVYSEADRNAIYLEFADECFCIGPAPAAQSYLDIAQINSAAEVADVEAIHPGYGFLAENAHFAEVCRSCKIEFIGPGSDTMTRLGNKIEARKLAKKAGVYVIPGSEVQITETDDAVKLANEIGYPVLIKASAGGGGRGIRPAHTDLSLVNGLILARSEAEASFDDGALYIEKMIEGARHIEVQLLGDHYGHIVHLGERDCSLQRRHQKMIEEAPADRLSPKLREDICEAAVKIAREANYTSAGTVEFLLSPDGHYYFLEVNCRVQVEHPVSEMVTGVDIVKEQIRIASGEPLSVSQKQVQINGVAIECRINAEDPANFFKPSPGKVERYFPPGGPGVRVDSHLYAGYTVPSNYDSLVAKLIVHRPTRQEAIACMRRALSEFVIDGIKTTIPFYREDIFWHSAFLRGEFDTTFIETEFK